MKQWQRRKREKEILDLALTHASNPVPDFKPILLLKELDHITVPKKRTIENLKAKTMVCLAARVKPTLVRRCIRDLRDKSDAMGFSEDFQHFETQMKTVVGGDFVIGHGFAPTTFASVDHSEVWNRIKHVFDVISDADFDFFLNSGTLLGIVRDGKLIDHDDDIDLAVRLTANDPKTAAQEWMQLRNTLDSMGLVDQQQFVGHHIIKLKIEGDFEMDLFPAWVEADRVFIFPHTFGELSETDVFPTKTCTTTGLPIPNSSEKVLAINYGEKWSTPDPYFKFDWRKANKTFSSFLGHLQVEAKRRR